MEEIRRHGRLCLRRCLALGCRLSLEHGTWCFSFTAKEAAGGVLSVPPHSRILHQRMLPDRHAFMAKSRQPSKESILDRLFAGND